MFIVLTNSFDTQPFWWRADRIDGIEAVDAQSTQVTLATGKEIVVKESVARVRDAIGMALGCELPLPPARMRRDGGSR